MRFLYNIIQKQNVQTNRLWKVELEKNNKKQGTTSTLIESIDHNVDKICSEPSRHALETKERSFTRPLSVGGLTASVRRSAFASEFSSSRFRWTRDKATEARAEITSTTDSTITVGIDSSTRYSEIRERRARRSTRAEWPVSTSVHRAITTRRTISACTPAEDSSSSHLESPLGLAFEAESREVTTPNDFWPRREKPKWSNRQRDRRKSEDLR